MQIVAHGRDEMLFRIFESLVRCQGTRLCSTAYVLRAREGPKTAASQGDEVHRPSRGLARRAIGEGDLGCARPVIAFAWDDLPARAALPRVSMTRRFANPQRPDFAHGSTPFGELAMRSERMYSIGRTPLVRESRT